ncbi:MAG TPA: nitroreductase family deazaflavin-dependent oxidoreductase [Iamia sp.]|nr:nitroreductase family deazaflavin-dependent oxidoreductase [Iamia sp.]
MSERSPEVKPYEEREIRMARRGMKLVGPIHVWLYRRSGGRIWGRFPTSKAPVLLLTTVGRRSGQPRTVPLIHLEDGDRLVIVASQGGMPTHPAWYHNVVAHPRVTVESGRRIRDMDARVADEAERAALWPRLVEMYADYDDYQARTDRRIPVVVLDPARG